MTLDLYALLLLCMCYLCIAVASSMLFFDVSSPAASHLLAVSAAVAALAINILIPIGCCYPHCAATELSLLAPLKAQMPYLSCLLCSHSKGSSISMHLHSFDIHIIIIIPSWSYTMTTCIGMDRWQGDKHLHAD